MLILERNVNEQIVINVDGKIIRVMLCQVRNDRQVRIGVDAPDDVVVYRAELKNFKPRRKAKNEVLTETKI